MSTPVARSQSKVHGNANANANQNATNTRTATNPSERGAIIASSAGATTGASRPRSSATPSSAASPLTASSVSSSGSKATTGLDSLTNDMDACPPPSLLHYEPPMPCPPLSRTSTRLFDSSCPPVARGSHSSDEDEEMSEIFVRGVKRMEIGDAAGGIKQNTKPTPHASANAAKESLVDKADRMWRQQKKWGAVLRRASQLEDNTSNDMENRRSGFVLYAQAHPQQVRRLISRGIPDMFRGYVWQQISGSSDFQWRAAMLKQQFNNNQQLAPAAQGGTSGTNASSTPSPPLSNLSPHGAYRRLLDLSLHVPLEREIEDQIIKDLNRTFPKQLLFRDRNGLGQNSLFHVLKAYSVFDHQLGYCQGMGYIAAGLLQFMNEEDAFWLLVCLLHHPRYGGLRGLFLVSMPKLNSFFYLLDQILKKDYSKLSQHFDSIQIHLSMFSSTWFMTLFAGSFAEFDNVARVWDVLMWQGQWFLIKVCVGMLKQAEKQLLGSSFEQCLSHLKSIQLNLKGDALIEQSLLVSLDYAECERWEMEYDREQRMQSAREKEYASSFASAGSTKLQRGDSGSIKETSNNASSWQSEADPNDDEEEHAHMRESSISLSQ